MTSVSTTAMHVHAVLRANPGAPAWKIAEVGMPVTVVGFALRELERAGLARRGRDDLGIVTWTATDEVP